MQVNKKHTDGQSDSSSIGSFLDDTDREVCSLTDRAFKSLCVAELESSYTEADPVVSPNISHQFSSKFSQGPRNHAIKKNNFPNKRLSKAEEHSTFQQFPNDPQEGVNAAVNITPSIRMKLGLPVPSLRNYKHTSKVSSLIRTFDKAENQEASAAVKPPVRNSLTKLPLICGGDMAFWGGKTLLKIQKELSGFSEPFQDMANASGRHELHRRQNKMDLACHGPRGFYRQADASNMRMSSVSAVSRKASKSRTGKAREPARKGSFLHSENSAFESWNLHHKKLETGGSAEIVLKEGNLTYFEETPFFREACIHESRPSPPPEVTTPVILEEDFSGAFPQKPLSQASLSPVPPAQGPFPPQAKAKDPVSHVLPPHTSDLPPPEQRIPTPPETSFLSTSQVSVPLKASPPPQSLPQACVPPEAIAHVSSALTPVSQVTVLSEKTSNSEFQSELKNVCPPWRKQKKELGGMGLAQEIAPEVLRMKDSSYRKLPDATPMAETFTDESQVVSSGPSSPSFNISKLLTPVLPPKQEREPSEGQSFLVTPPMSEAGTTKEAEERTLYSSQNNYKSKAPSLLFNLKDIRKRVKSTYSPSPLLRILDDKKIREQDSIRASVLATYTQEESNKEMAEAAKTSHKPSEQTDNTNDTKSFGHFIDSYPAPEDTEMSSLVDFHPNEHRVGQYSSANSHLADVPADLEARVQSFPLQDLKNKQVAPSHSADPEPQVSPYLFFTPEENINDNGNQACPLTGNEHRGKRSTSSSEQSFVSIIDQPFHDDSFSLMQLFQKACHQESQRSKNEWSAEEKSCRKEEEVEGRRSREEKQLHDHSLRIHGCHMDEKLEEQGKNVNAAEEREVKEKREDQWKNMDLASETKLEEPLTPTSPSSLKPNMFMIKDNTFKSSPVIKAVKLPLLRSLSCEETIPGNHAEAERQTFGPICSTPNIQEADLVLSSNRGQQDVRDAARGRDTDESRSIQGSQAVGKGPLTTEYTLREGAGEVYMQELVGEGEGDNITPGLSQKGLESSEEQEVSRDKEKARAGKVRRNSSSQPVLSFEGDPTQNRQKFPTREKANYFKNNLLSKRRGGSCVKKIISQETRSPTISETYSHASSDVLRDISVLSGTLTISTVPSPRSNSAMQSAFTSPFSDTSAVSNAPQAERIANPSSLHAGTESGKRSSALETSELLQTSQLLGDAGSSPVANERLQMVKTAGKPPAVPPKSEKALRRAKKLASKRQKIEAQQKKVKDEVPLHCSKTAPLQPVQSSLSPICLNSSLTPSESQLVRLQPAPSLSPTPSLPATTQRKLLQDPDSGEYFIVDLPVQFKTFYDPESGRYIQLSIPPSKRNLSQTPSSECVPSSYVLYPSTLPVRVSSVPAQASPSQFSESASLMQRALLESAAGWSQGGQYPEPLGSQPYIEPAVCDAQSQETDGLQYDFEKGIGLPDTTGIISMGAIEDFAVEGVS